MISRSRRVTSADGVGLAVFESGHPDGPVVVAVHGYPDNHSVWNGVAAQLGERFHVVAYDVRGTGDSDKPASRADYRMARLVDDLVSVIDAVSPDAPVSLRAHDWGSIQSWPALTDPRLAGRIRCFVSISGPSLDHAGAWMRGIGANRRAVLKQLAHSYYILLFQLPRLPELAARRGVIERAVDRSGHTARSPLAGLDPPHRTVADQVNGIWMYRANMMGRMGRPSPQKVKLPVLVVTPESDAFVTPALAVGAATPWVADLTTRSVEGGHWVVSERPDVIAGLASDFFQLVASRADSDPAESNPA